MEIDQFVKKYLEKLNDGTNMYIAKPFTFPEGHELVDYTVENRNLGFHIMVKLPIRKEFNEITLELHNFMGRKINQNRIKEIFTFECLFISRYSPNAYFGRLTEEQVKQFFTELNDAMKKVKEEFPFTGEENY